MITVLTNNLGITEQHLRTADRGDVQEVMGACNEIRKSHAEGRKGWDRKKEMKDLGKIPASVYWSKEFQCIFNNPEMDTHEKEKHLRKFYQMFPQFLCVDRI